MNDQEKEKITPLKNSEEHQKLVQGFEDDLEKEKQNTLEWKNAYLKSEQERKVLKQAKDKVEEERDDWKKEAHTQRKVQAESKQAKEQTDFLTQFKKLQEKKGLKWDEQREEWTKHPNLK